MTFWDEFAYSIGFFDYMRLLLELFFITSCLATIVYIATKNQYISYLATAPIFFVLAHIFYQTSHIILVIIAMSIQALVILFIQKQDLLGKLASKEKEKAPEAE
ncbi:hypothetical protein KQ939_13585 [Planococcus sp. CP5-4]|uniref:hypothetical protein n=1 Tax=unclassified Planococcus (in: firmicutes) TaxID=2662419 RepID=UPI001C24FEDC|nr:MULTISPECIES: hypothetical protein [unclassified Planococcus (in: firmicutes)]MBU9674444.1 hypothetical protein [Planococcus sp. CP5-4_YE]MBV0909734.1 hypothetical protein [Planococcus sp. CP5-4_UN]MBW6064717.1 hypothetical protein [Planococcus sp. CP5-4]